MRWEGPVAIEWFESHRPRPARSVGGFPLAHNRRDINDHNRRQAAIVALATRIGTALCQSEYRHLGESEWARLDRMRLQLGALRVEAGL